MIKRYVALLCLSAFFINGQVSAQYLRCTTDEVVQEAIKNDPEYARILAESNMRKASPGVKSTGTTYVIPVVFHIMHEYGPENLTKAQILDQIRVINEDFNRLNADTGETRDYFKSVAGSINIVFKLAQIDPNGNCTDGIIRVYSASTNNQDDQSSNSVKKVSPGWDRTKYLNIWTVKSIASGAAGYAYYPGINASLDGIVILYDYSRGATSTGGGRSLTHEIGHYLNLRHTWGNSNSAVGCTDPEGDQVDDTPKIPGPTTSCSFSQKACDGVTPIQLENYMDYSYCYNMFSQGQCDRVELALNSTASGRNNLWSQSNLVATGTDSMFSASPCAPKADFSGVTSACTGSPVTFKDASWNGEPTTWSWTFTGPETLTSADKDAVVTFSTPGTYTVKLKSGNTTGTDSVVRTNYLTIIPEVSAVFAPYAEGIESATFPDNGWRVVSDDATRKWERTTAASYTGSASIYIKNHSGNPAGKVDAFISPAINLSNATSATLKFRLAHAQRTASSSDKLTVGISKNCGFTYITKMTKSGSTLATAGVQSTEFTPSSSAQWAEQTVQLSNILGSPSGLIKFEATSGAGNNIYIDDINITVVTGVDQFVADNINFQAAPNPFSSTSLLSFFLVKESLVKISVYDVLGREIGTVLNQSLGFGEHVIELNAEDTGLDKSGIYIVKLHVDDNAFVQKILLNK